MAREQIRVRVDAELWERLKRKGESNTDLCDRILTDWQAQQQVLAALTAIDPSPVQAIGKLMLSYELISSAAISIQSTALPSPTAEAPATDVIGGLENNSDDW